MPPIPPAPIQIRTVQAPALAEDWPFIRRGLDDICRKIHPTWIPEQVFGAIASEAATACIVSRGNRQLGHFVWHKQPRNWKPFIIDIFVWTVWAIPLRERLPTDDVSEAIWRGREYLLGMKSDIGANKVIFITSAKRARAFEKRHGFRALFTTLEIQ